MEAEVLSRRCVVMRLADFSYDKYQKALRQSAGAVVIVLPKNMSTVPQDIVQVHTLINVIGKAKTGSLFVLPLIFMFLKGVIELKGFHKAFTGLLNGGNAVLLILFGFLYLCSSSWSWSPRC